MLAFTPGFASKSPVKHPRRGRRAAKNKSLEFDAWLLVAMDPGSISQTTSHTGPSPTARKLFNRLAKGFTPTRVKEEA